MSVAFHWKIIIQWHLLMKEKYIGNKGDKLVIHLFAKTLAEINKCMTFRRDVKAFKSWGCYSPPRLVLYTLGVNACVLARSAMRLLVEHTCFSSHMPFPMGSFSFTCYVGLHLHFIVDVNILVAFIFPRMYLTVNIDHYNLLGIQNNNTLRILLKGELWCNSAPSISNTHLTFKEHG